MGNQNSNNNNKRSSTNRPNYNRSNNSNRSNQKSGSYKSKDNRPYRSKNQSSNSSNRSRNSSTRNYSNNSNGNNSQNNNGRNSYRRNKYSNSKDQSYSQDNSDRVTRNERPYNKRRNNSYRGNNSNSNSNNRSNSRGYNRSNRSNNSRNYNPSQGRRNNNRSNNNRGGRKGRGMQVTDESIFIKDINPNKKVETYTPTSTFESLQIHSQLKNNVKSKGIVTPTEIQDKAIPHILDGKDVLGIANTGTGKTLTFLLPTLEKIANDPKSKVLIITPTRELAKQINDEFFDLTKDFRMYSVLATGGTNIGKQINGIKRGFNALIGTPGRIKDLINRGILNPRRFNTIVLDEVDRMLDMGFVHDIKEILSNVPQTRQSLFFSATINKKVEDVINVALTDSYTKISVRHSETTDNVKQDVVHIKSPREKFERLEELLLRNEFEKVLVFANTKRGVERIYKTLRDKGHNVVSIHGNKSQNQRQRALNSFKSRNTDVMVATDVAARGIDVDDITHVINYQVPESYEDYTHRIGRTGRANKTGVALTFIEKY